MKWIIKCFEFIFRKHVMALENFRDENGKFKPELISDGYVLLDYENKPICICVCANGVWLTFPFSEILDKELADILKEKYTTRYLKVLIEIQDKFEADLLYREEILKKSKTIRY